MAAVISAEPVACATELAAKAARTVTTMSRTKNFILITYPIGGCTSIDMVATNCAFECL